MSILAEISTDDPSKIEISAPARFYGLCKTLPNSRFKDGKYRASLTWPTCLQLRGIFKNDLEIGPNLLEWSTDWLNTRILPAMALRDATEAEGYPGLYDYQRAGVQFLSTAKRAILADGLGSGKTYVAFASIRWVFEQLKENIFPVLIVCPNSTKIAWSRAVENIWPGLRVTVIQGTASQRKKQFKEFSGQVPCVIHDDKAKIKKVKNPHCTCPGHVVIINWEAVRSHSRIAPYGSNAIKKCQECGGLSSSITPAKCQAHEKELNLINFGAIIADEAHRMKTASAFTTRALKAATGNAKYRFALTGTPIANAPDDLWSILNWMYPDAFPSKTKFIDRYLEVTYNVWGAATVIGIKQGMEKEFFAFLDPILRRMPKEVVLPHLPPVVYERRNVEMSAKQQKAYTQMKEQMLAEINGDVLIQTSPLTKMTRLLQLAATYMDVENVTEIDKTTGQEIVKQKVTLTEPSCKLDAFMDDIEDFDGESVVVFSPSKQVINLLAARLDKAKIPYGRITGDEDSMERQFHMDNFQSGKIQFILCTTGAGGTGITLTKARIAVYLGRPFSNVDSEQSEGRVHRLGSEIHDSILYIDYVTAGTVEEQVFDLLEEKGERLQSVLRDKELLKKVIEGESA